MNIAVIGNGSIGMRHANNLLRMKHSVLVIDSDPATTSSKLLSEQLRGHDAAVICVPTDQHLSMLRKCINKGLPTYIEKPLGHYTQRDQWRRLSKEKDLPRIMVGYQLRFHPSVRHFIRIQGKQKVIGGQFRCDCDMSTWQGKSSQGNFLEEMSHEIDLALYLGAKELTTCEYDARRRYAKLSFSGGWGDWSFEVELCGSQRSYSRLWALQTRFMRMKFDCYDPVLLGNEMYEDAMRHFINAVKNKRGMTEGCTLSQAINVMDVIQKVSDSQ